MDEPRRLQLRHRRGGKFGRGRSGHVLSDRREREELGDRVSRRTVFHTIRNAGALRDDEFRPRRSTPEDREIQPRRFPPVETASRRNPGLQSNARATGTVVVDLGEAVRLSLVQSGHGWPQRSQLQPALAFRSNSRRRARYSLCGSGFFNKEIALIGSLSFPINIRLACFFARRAEIVFCFAKIAKPAAGKKRTEFRNCRREESAGVGKNESTNWRTP